MVIIGLPSLLSLSRLRAVSQPQCSLLICVFYLSLYILLLLLIMYFFSSLSLSLSSSISFFKNHLSSCWLDVHKEPVICDGVPIYIYVLFKSGISLAGVELRFISLPFCRLMKASLFFFSFASVFSITTLHITEP